MCVRVCVCVCVCERMYRVITGFLTQNLSSLSISSLLNVIETWIRLGSLGTVRFSKSLKNSCRVSTQTALSLAYTHLHAQQFKELAIFH